MLMCGKISDLCTKCDKEDSSVNPENLEGGILSNLGTQVTKDLVSLEED
jgi:hypothetical protein